MPVGLTVISEPSAKDVLMFIQALLTGSFPAGGFEAIDLTTVQNLTGHNFDGFFENPSVGGVFSATTNGYTVQLVPGSTLSNWELIVYTAPGVVAGNVTYASLGIASPENVVILEFVRRLM
jgi:hypothetical protein